MVGKNFVHTCWYVTICPEMLHTVAWVLFHCSHSEVASPCLGRFNLPPLLSILSECLVPCSILVEVQHSEPRSNEERFELYPCLIS